jgi:hypothetical protein
MYPIGRREASKEIYKSKKEEVQKKIQLNTYNTIRERITS